MCLYVCVFIFLPQNRLGTETCSRDCLQFAVSTVVMTQGPGPRADETVPALPVLLKTSIEKQEDRPSLELARWRSGRPAHRVPSVCETERSQLRPSISTCFSFISSEMNPANLNSF